MAYVRFGEGSDVYMYEHVGGFIECCACRFTPTLDPPKRQADYHPELEGTRFGDFPVIWEDEFPSFTKRSEAIEHLLEHRRAGHQVPDHPIERLRREIGEKGNRVG